MLSATRFTMLDLMAVVMLTGLIARLFASDTPHHHAYTVQAADPSTSIARMLDAPLPNPATAPALARQAMLDVRMRCMGLDQALCHQNGCQVPTFGVGDIHYTLWPKGYAGDFAADFLRRVTLYAQAYRTLTDRDMVTADQHSKLILDRDSAMCSRYRWDFQAQADEHQDRQPS